MSLSDLAAIAWQRRWLSLGVAMVTAGPGVTNTVTAMANASLARAPVLLIGGCTSRPQANMGPLQDIPHVDIMRPVTRFSRTARVHEQVLRELDEAIARAMGDMGEPGPVYLEVPTDVLRAHLPEALIPADWLAPKRSRRPVPSPESIDDAVTAIREARRPLVVSGRGARQAGDEIIRFLNVSNALYLDTQESRGLVPADHPSVVGAVRAAAMGQADLVITLGRKLDLQEVGNLAVHHHLYPVFALLQGYFVSVSIGKLCVLALGRREVFFVELGAFGFLAVHLQNT
jgi:acetolactate synthase-1/2/3 large subunit